MCVRAQRSSEEAFRFFGRNLPILRRSFLICGAAAPQTHFGKTFKMSASFFFGCVPQVLQKELSTPEERAMCSQESCFKCVGCKPAGNNL